MNGQLQAVRERILAKGYLTEAQLDAAQALYATGGQALGFGAFLRQEGLLSLAQLSALQPPTVVMDDAYTGRRFASWLVGSKLGEGGMGRVYRTYHEETGAEAVIKFLAPDLAAKRSWRARFVHTARLLEGAKHPALLQVYAVEGRGEHPYVVMELVRGETLEELLMRRGALPGLEVARLGRELALGLEAAHAHGLVHRDIKPSNVSVVEQRIKLLDFDLAKSARVEEGLTRAGQVMGTPQYMAPEQWGEHVVDARADLFSLGATLYHLATGYLPFQGQRPREIADQILAGDFVPPRQRVRDLPIELERVLLRLLEPDRAYRYQTARQVAEDLQHVLDGRAVNVPRLVEATTGALHPLLQGASFTIGRDEGCDVTVVDPSVSRRHAVIRRHDGGYLLVDRGSKAGSYVGGVRIQDARLKRGDRVHLGTVELVFEDGGASASPHAGADASPPVSTVPEPLLIELQQLGDRRVVLWLIEQLAPRAQQERLEEAVRGVDALLGAEAAALVRAHLVPHLQRLRSLLPGQLFAITHENLGDAGPAWLRWWADAQPDYPGQLAQEKRARRARLLLVRDQTPHHLDGRDRLSLGRDAGADLVLDDRTVSRHHATVLRLHQQLVIRDEESRFGTFLNGQRQPAAFLSDGDLIKVGALELLFQREPLPGPYRDASGAYAIDAEAFQALLEARHPAAVSGAIAFLEAQDQVAWLLEEAGRLFEKPSEAVHFANRVHRRYLNQSESAHALLGAVLGVGPTTATAWRTRQADASLPAQVLPLGWFPASWDSLDTAGWRLG